MTRWLIGLSDWVADGGSAFTYVVAPFGDAGSISAYGGVVLAYATSLLAAVGTPLTDPNPLFAAAGAVLRATVVLALTFAVAAAFRRASAATVHLIWSAGLAAAIAVPILVAVLPWRVGVVPVPAALAPAGEAHPVAAAAPEPVTAPPWRVGVTPRPAPFADAPGPMTAPPWRVGVTPRPAPFADAPVDEGAAPAERAPVAGTPAAEISPAAAAVGVGAVAGGRVTLGPGSGQRGPAASGPGAAIATWPAAGLGILPPSPAVRGMVPAPPAPHVAPVGLNEASSPPVRVPASLPVVLLAVWAVVAAALVLRLGFGILAVRRLVRDATPVTSPAWTRPFRDAADRLGLSRTPRLLLTDRVLLPFTAGVRRPVIVLPATAGDWGEERRRAVILHELGHVRRRDVLSQHIGRLACAFYWFNPLVWVAAARARNASERACDDLVLAAGIRPSAYAGHLLQIVRAAAGVPAPAAALAMAQRSGFEGRVLAILEDGVRRGGPGRSKAAALAAAAASVAVLLAAVAPAAGTAAAGEEAGSADPAPVIPTLAVMEPQPADTPAPPPAPTPPPPPPEPADTDRVIVRVPRHGPATSIWYDSRAGVHIDVDSVLNMAMEVVRLAVPEALEAVRSSLPEAMGALNEALAALPDFRFSDLAGFGRAAPIEDPQVIQALLGALDDPAPSVRAEAARTLHRAGADPRVVPALVRRLQTDDDADIRRVAAWGLGRIGDTAAAAALAGALRNDPDARVREMAAWALGQMRAAETIDAMRDAARSDTDAAVRETALWALVRLDDPATIPDLAEVLAGGATPERERAAWAIGHLAPESAPAALIRALDDESAAVRQKAAWAIGRTRDPAAANAVATLRRNDEDDGVRRAALWALLRIGEAEPDVLVAALEDDDPEVRRRAVRALAGDGAWPWPWPWPMPRPRPAP